MTSAEVAAPRTRQRNRKDIILLAAAELFRDRGFHSVGIDDVGEAVGITGPAIYRHFKSKEDLLTSALHRHLDALVAALADIEIAGRGADAVRDVVQTEVATSMADWNFAVVFHREGHKLPRGVRTEVFAKRDRIINTLTRAVRELHPTLEGPDLRLRLEAQYGLLTGVLSMGSQTLRRRYEPVVIEMATAALLKPEVPPVTPRAHAMLHAGDAARASRRETVLSAAIERFATASYPAIGIDETGVAAGITGPSVYRHFANKEALLIEAVQRMGHTLAFNLAGVLSLDADPLTLVDLLTARLVDLAHENPDLLVVYVNDAAHLSGSNREFAEHGVATLIDEWDRLLRLAHPDIPEHHSRAVVVAVFGAIIRAARSPQLRPYDVRKPLRALLSHIQHLPAT